MTEYQINFLQADQTKTVGKFWGRLQQETIGHKVHIFFHLNACYFFRTFWDNNAFFIVAGSAEQHATQKCNDKKTEN